MTLKKGDWSYNLEDDVYFFNFFNTKPPSKAKVLAYKRRTRPNYKWKIEDLKSTKGYRLFFKKK